MRFLVPLLVCLFLSAGSVSAEQEEAAQSADTSKVVVVREDGARKQVNVPQPKTNWSKIKELFM